MPKPEQLISKMLHEKSKQVRHDWSEGEADGESLIEQDMKSVTSDIKIGPSQNAL